MIERIEVLTDGASSVYGSDAIAGVVNFILRSDYQGAEFSANYGISDKDDGEQPGLPVHVRPELRQGQRSWPASTTTRPDSVLAGHRKFSKNAVSLYGTARHGRRQHVRRRFDVLAVRSHRDTGCSSPDLYPGLHTGSSRAIPARAARTSRPTTTATSTTARRRPERQVQLRDGQPDHDPAGTHRSVPQRQLQADGQRRSVRVGPAQQDLVGVPAGAGGRMARRTARSFRRTATTTRSASSSADDGHDLPCAPRLARQSQRVASAPIPTRSRPASRVRSTSGTTSSGTGMSASTTATSAMRPRPYGLPNLEHRSTRRPVRRSSIRRRRRALRHARRADRRLHADQHLQPRRSEHDRGAAGRRLRRPSATSITQEKVSALDLNGGLFELPAGTVQLAVGASYRKEYTHSQRRYVAADQPRDRQLHAGQPVRLGAAGRLQRQGSVRGAVRPDPQGHAVRARVEPDARRPLLEVQQLRQHQQREDRAGMASDRRPAAARHGLRSVPCADRRRHVRRGGQRCTEAVAAIRAIGYTGNPTRQSGLRQRADRRHVPEPERAAGCRSTASLRARQFAGFPLGPEFGKSFDFGVVYDPHFIEGLSVSADLWRLYLNNNITGDRRAERARSVLRRPARSTAR